MSPYATDSFSAAYATVGPAASARATFSASPRSSDDGTSRLAIPSSKASCAVMLRGKSSSIGGAARSDHPRQVHEMPESAVSATLAKDVLKAAVSATIR